MSMTRQRAKSSFTVEIKRANKRSPDVIAVRGASATGSELADQVFGGPMSRPASRPERNPRSEAVAAAMPETSRTQHKVVEDGTRSRSPEGHVRRILPDLLAVEPNPVEQRIRQQAEEHAARRKATLEQRRRTAPVQPQAKSQPTIAAPAPASAPVTVASETGPRAEAAASSGPQVSTSQQEKPAKKRGRDSYTAMKKDRRAGLQPQLPLGERWKRRLPQACW
jgi:hypothetical protein